MPTGSKLVCSLGSLAPFACHKPSLAWGTPTPGTGTGICWLESSEDRLGSGMLAGRGRGWGRSGPGLMGSVVEGGMCGVRPRCELKELCWQMRMRPSMVGGGQ